LSAGGSIRKNRKKKQKSYKNHRAVRKITRGANLQKYERSILAQIFPLSRYADLADLV